MADVNALFDQLSELQVEQKLPPVATWHPEHTGTIDIRIASDGSWFHEGDPILRAPLVKLFSTVLRKDPDGYCLVTPEQKLIIVVDDAPFVAIDVEVKGAGADQQLMFTTNVGEYVLASATHPIRVAGTPELPRPYLHVRDGLEALIGRSVYYRLVDLCEEITTGEPSAGFWLTSAGERFKLG